MTATDERRGTGTTGHVDNAVVVAAPIDLVWEMTNDLESWPSLFTEYAAVEILDRDGDTVRFRLTMKPDENGTVWSWVSERTPHAPSRTVSARRVETGPFEFVEIAWSYEEVPGGTRMRWVQDFAMKPTAPIDTEAMTARMNRNTPVQMEAVRAGVEAAARAAASTPRGATVPVVAAADVAVNRRRGGEVRAVLTPSTCGSTTGFVGTVVLAPGEVVTEHWHPYSEEFLFVTAGTLTVRLDGEPRTVGAQEGVCIPIGVRHRLANPGPETVTAVFGLAPLAPAPHLGHVDTEELPGARPSGGGR